MISVLWALLLLLLLWWIFVSFVVVVISAVSVIVIVGSTVSVLLRWVLWELLCYCDELIWVMILCEKERHRMKATWLLRTILSWCLIGSSNIFSSACAWRNDLCSDEIVAKVKSLLLITLHSCRVWRCYEHWVPVLTAMGVHNGVARCRFLGFLWWVRWNGMCEDGNGGGGAQFLFRVGYYVVFSDYCIYIARHELCIMSKQEKGERFTLSWDMPDSGDDTQRMILVLRAQAAENGVKEKQSLESGRPWNVVVMILH